MRLQLELLLAKYTSNKMWEVVNVVLAVIIVSNYYAHFLNETIKTTLIISLFINFFSVIFNKYKFYKLPIREQACEELFRLFEHAVNEEYDFNSKIYVNEVFARNNRFKYTEIFVLLNGVHRVIIEEYVLANLKNGIHSLKVKFDRNVKVVNND